MNQHDEINRIVKEFEKDFIGHILNRIILELKKHYVISK